jgi:hypothetical protein
LQRFSAGSTFHKLPKSPKEVFAQLILGVTDQKRPILPKDERKKRTRFATRLRHTRVVQNPRRFPNSFCDGNHLFIGGEKFRNLPHAQKEYN